MKKTIMRKLNERHEPNLYPTIIRSIDGRREGTYIFLVPISWDRIVSNSPFRLGNPVVLWDWESHGIANPPCKNQTKHVLSKDHHNSNPIPPSKRVIKHTLSYLLITSSGFDRKLNLWKRGEIRTKLFSLVYFEREQRRK